MYDPLTSMYPIQMSTIIKYQGPAPKEVINEKKKRNKMKREKKREKRKSKGNLEMNTQRSSGSAPVAYAYGNKNFRGGGKTLSFTNSEMIGSVSGSTGFSVNSYSVNPGLPGTFPWLSGTAANFQQYVFRKLSFEYIPSVATTASGLVVLSPDYNVRDHPPTSLSEASNTEDASSKNTWSSVLCKLIPERMFTLGRRKDVRTSQISGELNIYDAARLHVATIGQADTSVIGNLWVHYEVILAVPQSSPLTDTLPSYTSFYTNTGSQAVTTSVATHVLLNLVYDPIGFGGQISGSFVPPAGSYWLTALVQINDSSAVEVSHFVQFYKNGAGLNPTSSYLGTGGVDGSDITIPVQTIVNCNGTDTIWLSVFCVASGLILLPSQAVSLTVCLA